VAEHKAFLDANNAISWKDFLSKKLNDRMGNEIEKVINTELNFCIKYNASADQTSVPVIFNSFCLFFPFILLFSFSLWVMLL
jgi:hypothetical protein